MFYLLVPHPLMYIYHQLICPFVGQITWARVNTERTNHSSCSCGTNSYIPIPHTIWVGATLRYASNWFLITLYSNSWRSLSLSQFTSWVNSMNLSNDSFNLLLRCLATGCKQSYVLSKIPLEASCWKTIMIIWGVFLSLHA